MLVDLAVAPTEQARPLLHATFDAPVRPHLVSVRWRIAGFEVTAGILAASHQVVVPSRFVETVACDQGGGSAVADGTTIDGVHHRFTASVEELEESALRSLVGRCLDLSEGEGTIVGRFPTDRFAVTAVHRTKTGWDTVHTYPNPNGEPAVVVSTSTEILP